MARFLGMVQKGCVLNVMEKSWAGGKDRNRCQTETGGKVSRDGGKVSRTVVRRGKAVRNHWQGKRLSPGAKAAE